MLCALLFPNKPLFLWIFQLTAEDYSSMSRLLSPLETLSQEHPEVVIQELASNLRAVIATHGAYRPENLTTATAHSSKESETKPKNNSVPVKKKKKAQTEANISQTTPLSPSLDANTPSSSHIGHPASSTAGTSPKSGGKSSSSSSDLSSSTKAFSECLLEACDPDVPTRAVALRVLTRMVQNRDPEAVQAQEKVLIVSRSYHSVSSQYYKNKMLNYGKW